jgi:hypothetical protein
VYRGGGGCENLQNLYNCGASIEKQIIMAFKTMYLEIINNDMVGLANTTARDMLDHLFLSYGSITDVDLEHNWENTRKAWDPHQYVESLFKQIQDCVDYAEAGGSQSVRHKSSRLCTPRSLQMESSTLLTAVGMTDLLQSILGMRLKITLQWPTSSTSKCRGGAAAASRYTNPAVAQPADEDLARAAIDAFANLATANAVDRGIAAALTEANSRLTK